MCLLYILTKQSYKWQIGDRLASYVLLNGNGTLLNLGHSQGLSSEQDIPLCTSMRPYFCNLYKAAATSPIISTWITD